MVESLPGILEAQDLILTAKKTSSTDNNNTQDDARHTMKLREGAERASDGLTDSFSVAVTQSQRQDGLYRKVAAKSKIV